MLSRSYQIPNPVEKKLPNPHRFASFPTSSAAGESMGIEPDSDHIQASKLDPVACPWHPFIIAASWIANHCTVMLSFFSIKAPPRSSLFPSSLLESQSLQVAVV
jgi:hypothetical protein